jgi:hypothetical protein
MKKLEKQERIAKLVRYNLISLFYLILVVATSFIIAYNWEKIVEIMPLLQSMLTFGV